MFRFLTSRLVGRSSKTVSGDFRTTEHIKRDRILHINAFETTFVIIETNAKIMDPLLAGGQYRQAELVGSDIS